MEGRPPAKKEEVIMEHSRNVPRDVLGTLNLPTYSLTFFLSFFLTFIRTTYGASRLSWAK